MGRLTRLARLSAKRLLLSSFLLVLAGCATHPPYGDFAGAGPAFDERMAEDAALQLSALHPPAQTQIRLAQGASDAFGTALAGRLRKAGYAVAFDPPPSNPGQSAQNQAARRTLPGLPLRYLVDKAGQGRYVLRLQLGGESLSRVYAASGGQLAAAGYWAREVGHE